MESEDTETSTTASSFTGEYLKLEHENLSIYPPPPLDATVKAAFPNCYSSLSSEKLPSAWPYLLWNTFLIFLAMTGCIFPIIVFFLDTGSTWFNWSLIIIFGGPLLMSLPVWFLFFLYRPPAPVVPAPPINEDTAVAVDILVTSYKEDLDELAGTLASVQNLIWHGAVRVYVLDDAARRDVSDLCCGMKSAKYPITRVTRDGNAGKKAGNVNNFMKVMPRRADFFVILDCDMRPFPNMLQLLFGCYFDVSTKEERDRVGFITTPQFFRNYNHKTDHYEILSACWVNLIMPALGNINTVPFIGTNALWKRDALERAGGFFTEYATEDVSTGCKVHTTDNENGDKYISKYVPLPVAAGLNPRTLAELMDQHNRWNIGQAQMTLHFNFFWFCEKLQPIQRFVYFTTLASWTRHIPSFFIFWFGSIFFNIFAAFQYKPNLVWNPPVLTIVATVCSVILPTLPWLLIPSNSFRSRCRGMQMSLIYITTEIVGLLVILGYKAKVKFSSDSKASKWHPHFYFHIVVYVTIFMSSLFSIFHCMWVGVTSIVPYLQAVFLIGLWSIAFSPVARALFGHEDHEDKKWMALEEGRVDLYNTPIWSERDSITFEQMKATVVRLYQRVEEQENQLKKLQVSRSLSLVSTAEANSSST